MQATLGYRPALDGIRAVAIALVVAHHTAAFLAPGAADDVARGGFLGVDVFLVLSGFLITTLLLERREREARPIATFYGRRALRLLPAVVVLLLAVVVYTAIAGGLGDALRSLLPVLAYVTNWAELLGTHISRYVTHLWSLAIEEQFYLVWPVVLFGALRLGASRRALLVAVLAAVPVVAVWRAVLFDTGHGWLRIYLRTDARADALLVGAALALLPRDRIVRALHGRGGDAAGLAALAAVVATAWLLRPSSAFLYRGGFTLVALAAVAVVAVALDPASAVARLLAWRPAVELGRVSYSLYLWHFPVFLVVAERTASWSTLPRVLVGWALALAAAVASYRLVERPALAVKRRLGRPAASRPGSAPEGAPA